MATNTITKTKASAGAVGHMRMNLPGWGWFVALWGAGVGAAMGIGAVFKVLMNVTLFAVSR